MQSDPHEQVTQLLDAIQQGQVQAANKLLPLVYDELRRLAAHRLSREEPGQTLQPTALVHEAYLRLVGSDDAPRMWQNRRHFFAAAAEAMRYILVDIARRKRTLKHGHGLARQPLDAVEQAPSPSSNPVDILALVEALDQFAMDEPEAARLVALRYFAGLSIEQAAETMGISRATASRHWTFAKAWLRRAMGDSPER